MCMGWMRERDCGQHNEAAAKGEPRVNTEKQPSGNPPSGSLLPEITAITVSDFSQDRARLC
jgi:hypothetical protein